MADQLQLRGGTTNEHSTFTGALREVTVDTDKDTLIVHDAATAGGHPLAKEDLSNVPTGTITSTMIADGTIVNADINASAEIAVSKLADGAARQLLQTDAAGTGVEWTNNVDVPGTLDVTSVATFDNIASHSLGAAATPSITFTGDTNTGLYSPGADQVAISTNGQGRLFVASDGTVKVGNNLNLDILDGLGDVSLRFNNLSSSQNSGRISVDPNNTGSGSVLQFDIDGSQKLRIDSSGRVGIGTSSPSAKLQIKGAGNLSTTYNTWSGDFLFVDSTDATAGNGNFGPGVTWGALGTSNNRAAGIASVQTATDSNQVGLAFFTHPSSSASSAISEALRIDHAGNVGVGTTSPDGNVHIADSTRANLILKKTGLNDVASGTLANEYDVIQLGAGGSFASYNVETATADTHIGHNFYRHSSGPQRYKYTDAAARIRFNSSQGEIIFDRAASGTANTNITFSESLRIDSSGRVGIGTSAPNELLQVGSRTGSPDGAIEIAASNGGNPNNYQFLKFKQSGNTYGISLSTYRYVSGGRWYNDLRFNTGDSGIATVNPRMTITAGGNVGIGTTSPDARLDILTPSSTGTESGLIVQSSTEATDFHVERSGSDWRLKSSSNLRLGADYDDNSVSGDSNIIFETDGSEGARIDRLGRLLVGTSTARTNFYGSGSNYAQILNEGTSYASSTIASISNSSGYGSYLVLGRSRGTAVGSNTIVQSGDAFGIIDFLGADGSRLIQGARIYAEVDGTPGSGDMPGRLVFSTTADGASSPTERMRITNGGIILIGTTNESPGANNTVGGHSFKSDGRAYHSGSAAVIYANRNSSTGTLISLRYNGAERGTITTDGTNVAYNTSSDYRLKENVTAVTDGITRLQQLKPSRFNFIADPDKTVDGFIAHEVQDIVPEAVTGEKDAVDDEGNPVYQGIDQSKLVPLLTAALQEAIGEIESLKARVAALEAN